VASDPERFEAVQRARDTGQPSATGRLMLVQEPGREAGIVVFLPIDSPGLPPTTLAERHQRLQGYVTGVFRIGAMVEAALAGLKQESITLWIEDKSAQVGQRVLYDGRELRREDPTLPSHDGQGKSPTGMSWETTIELAGRHWVLHFAPTLTYLAARQISQPWAVLSSGLAFTSLLGAFLLIVTGRTTMIEQLMVERTAQLEASQRQEERFRVAVEAAPNAMLMVDQAGTIVLLNSQAEALFGYARTDLIGQPIERLVPERYRRQHPAHRAAFFLVPDARPMGAGRDLFGLHKDGHEIPVEIGLNPLRTEEGSFVLAAVIDITARKQAAAEIRVLYEDLELRVGQRTSELEAANQELATFSYSVAHDLRAPLRAIHSFSHILLEDYSPQLDVEAQGYLQRVSTNALRMGQLIDDLLAFAQLSQQPLQKQRVVPADLVHEALGDLRLAYEHRQVDLCIEELPICQADPVLLKQVWVNLLENALKFTRERSMTRIQVGSRGHEDKCVYFVRDNGVGFDMQYADKLFGVFQRLHPAVDYEGTGVGLALAQRIIQRHGGRIWAEAAVDRGATFSFTLGA
jgi:PAS domain S-box-containing protein